MMSITEEWRAVVGFEGLYEVSNLGRMRRLDRVNGVAGARANRRGRMLKCHMPEASYTRVLLRKDGAMRNCLVHRLVAAAFIPNPDNLPQVNHKDLNKANNNVGNLEWCTSSQNCLHSHQAYEYGYRKGEKHYGARLTEEQVLRIREERKTGVYYDEIGEPYGVTGAAIAAICRRKSWTHI